MALLSLVLGGCQPYLDHERSLFDFQAGVVDFGPRRQLELKTLEGDQSSLLFVFNQPLRLPADATSAVPFEIALNPAVPVAKIEYEGVAGVRLTLARPLANSSEYTVEIPSGWRAVTGIALQQPIRRSWSTPRPALSEIKVEGESASAITPGRAVALAKGKSLVMVFNQPVALGSVKTALRWEPLEVPVSGDEPPATWRLQPITDQQGQPDHTRFLFHPGADSLTAHRLVLQKGIKGLEGPLRSDKPQEILVEPAAPPLRYLGAVDHAVATDQTLSLEFSDSVPLSEIERCLVSVPSSARPNLSLDRSSPQRVVLRFTEDKPSRLLLLAGMTASQGSRLVEEVSLSLSWPATHAEPGPMAPLFLASGRLAPDRFVRTAAWKLTLDQALAASLLAQAVWQDRSSLEWEKRKPDYLSSSSSGRRFWGEGAGPGSFLAVRGTTSSGDVERALVVDSEIDLLVVPTSQGLRIQTVGHRDGKPVAGCELTLRGQSSAAVMSRGRSDAQGLALLGWDPAGSRSDSLFVVARRGKSVNFRPVLPASPPPSPLPAAFLMTDQPFYSAGQPVLVNGFLWSPSSQGAPPRVSVTIHPEGGKIAAQTVATLRADGFFQTRLPAPSEPGRYTLSVLVPGEAPGKTTFRVCPEAQEDESYSLSLQQVEGRFRATVDRQGARHREVEERAYIVPPSEQRDEVAGWTPVSGLEPAWITLSGESKEGDFLVALPDKLEGGTLVVEVFDSDQPSLVLARAEQPLVAEEPNLALVFDGRASGWGKQAVRPEVRGWDGEVTSLSATLRRRASPSLPWQTLDKRDDFGTEEGAWKIYLNEVGEYRLSVRATLADGRALESIWERRQTADDVATSGLSVDPAVAIPGAELLTALTSAEEGLNVWFATTAGDLQQGRFERVAAAGQLLPWTAPFARTDALRIAVQWPGELAWGQQRMSWSRRLVPVPVGPLSREAKLKLLVEREDRVKAPIAAEQKLHLNLQHEGPGGGWTGFLIMAPERAGWATPSPKLLASFLGQEVDSTPLPETYPLLETQSDPASEIWTDLSLDQAWDAVTSAPSNPGAYRLVAVARDSEGRFAWTSEAVEVAEISSWSAFAPMGARVGDKFEAGIKFVAGPNENGPLGLTASALEGAGRLVPSGYLTTAGVAKQGDTRLLKFSYRLGENLKERALLAWELGHGGKRHQQTAEVPVLDTEPVPRGGRLASLGSEQNLRLPLKGPLPWRLVLHPPKEGREQAWLALRGPKGSLGKVHLGVDSEPIVFQGAGPGTVEIAHLGGPSLGYEMFRLEPDEGSTTAWGSRCYLFRHLISDKGKDITTAVVGQRYRVVINLVNPLPLSAAKVRLPLPGGVRPLGLEPLQAGTPSPSWEAKAGVLEFDLEDLDAGEFIWELEVESLAVGDYIWPTARVLGPGNGVLALSGSGRLTVVEK